MIYEQNRKSEFSRAVSDLIRDGADLETRLRKHAVSMLCDTWQEYGFDLDE